MIVGVAQTHHRMADFLSQIKHMIRFHSQSGKDKTIVRCD